MAPRVLVTRPQPGSDRTAERLAQAGFHPLALPLTEVKPCRDVSMDVDPDTVAVAITSPNALRLASGNLVDRLSDIPVFAVGKTSARSAENRGLKVAGYANSDALALAALLGRSLNKEARIAYVCGKVRRPEFESEMKAAGFKIQAIETYDSVPVSYSTENLQDILGKDMVAAAVFHSARTAGIFDCLFADRELPQLTDKTWFFCFSPNVAEKLKSVPRDRVIVAAGPSDDDLIAALCAIFG